MPPAAETTFRSAPYWEGRYRAGGDSGAGSRGHLAAYKAKVLNALIQGNDIATAIEFGCGDGQQLALLQVRDYTGLDVSPTALARCHARFAGHPGRHFRLAHDLSDLPAAELGLSLDVIYHLVEDDMFTAHLQALFTHAWRYVAIYASDTDASWASPHVRHRRFTPYVARTFPDWQLAAVLPNPYRFDPALPNDTSFAAFHLYRQRHESLRLALPAVEAQGPLSAPWT